MKDRKYLKQFLAFVLSAAMVLTYMPLSMLAFAEDGAAEAAASEPTAAAAEEQSEPASVEKVEVEPKAAAAEEQSEPAPVAEENSESAPSEEAAPAASDENSDTAKDEQAAEENSDAETSEAVTEEQTDPEAEATEEKEEETKEEVKYPADTFKGSAGGVSVVINAPEGALPEGTKLTVTPVAASEVQDAVEGAIGGEAASIKAVDITFSYKGKEIEPQKAVKVHMNASGMANEANQSVVHIADNGKASVVTEAVSNGNTTFNSKDFSVYVVVEQDEESQDENAVATYEFYVGDVLKNTQYIKTGDKLADPGDLAGDGATSVFKGWYVQEDQTIEAETPGAKLTFGEKTSIAKTETIKIEAKVETTYYVTFRGEPDANGDRGIAAVDTVTVEGPAGTEGTLDISERTVIPKADTSAFEGWSETDGGDVITDTTITVKESKELYAVIVEANWIHFNENIDWETSDSDATYTGPVFVKKTDNLSSKKPTDPDRPGYEFGGWYEDPECTKAFQWSGTGLQKDITLYAKWNPAKSGYTVVVWKQKVTDPKGAADSAKTYDFESSEGVESMTGTVLSEDDFDTYKNLKFTGFHYGRIEFDPEDKKVRADGTTVVNVYYDRNLLTIYFFDGGSTHLDYTPTTGDSGQQYGLVDGEYVALDRKGNEGNYTWTYAGEPTVYEGTTYREASGTTGTQYGFADGKMQKLEYVDAGCGGTYWQLPDGQRYDGDRYVEGATGNNGYGVVDGELIGITHDDDGWKYNAAKEYTGTRYVISSVPSEENIYTGLYGSTLASNNYTWKDESAWYESPRGGTRLTFLDAFKFEGLSGVSENYTVLTQYAGELSGRNPIRFYKQNIDGTWPDDAPTNTVYTSNNSTFTITEKYEGFKAVSYSHGTPENWTSAGAGTSTDARNLNIRFERQKFTLTFIDPTNGEVIDTKTNIPYEDTMEQHKPSTDPTKTHYDFKGWCEDPSGKAPFNWSSKMPAANKVLYAKFEPKQYHVTLDTNGGHIKEGSTQDVDFNVPLDTELNKNSLFQCVEYDSKHEFVGWFYKDGPKAGSVYDYGKIEEDVNLIAKWRMPGEVSIEYDAGEGGSGAPEDNFKYATDSAVVVGAPPTTINEGYMFVGWELVKDPGKTLYPNNTFNITEEIIEDYDETAKTGKVRLQAVYNKTNDGPFEKTYIRWFNNDGSDCFHVDTLDNPSGDVADSTLLVNQGVAIQSAPTREGYVFLGWAKVEDTGDSIDTEQDLDENDLLIRYKDGKYISDISKTECSQVAADNDRKYEAMFAVWKEKVVTINYAVASDSAGMGTVSPDKETVKVKTDTAKGSTATAGDDYEFVNWTDKDGKEVSTSEKFVPAKVSGKNVAATYYANFKEKEVEIKYVAKTGGSVTPTSEKVKIKTDTAKGSTATAAEGYEFVNWTDKDGKEVGTSEKFVPAKVGGKNVAATYYANFKEKEVEIKYESADTTMGTVDPASENVKVVTGKIKGSTATPAEGYEFVNWTKDGKEVSKAATFVPTEKVAATYTANFQKKEPATHTVSYKYTGNAPSGAPAVPADQDYSVGDEVTVADAPTMEGYTFSGWSKTGTFEMPDEDVEITGSWTKVPPEPAKTADITYNLNGGTYNGSTADIVETYDVGEVIKIHAAPTRDGYVFVEWRGSSYQPGDSYTVEGDHTFTAIWEAEATPEDEDTPDDGDKSDKKTDSSKGVKTGDDANMIGWLMLTVIAGAGVVYMARRRKENE